MANDDIDGIAARVKRRAKSSAPPSQERNWNPNNLPQLTPEPESSGDATDSPLWPMGYDGPEFVKPVLPPGPFMMRYNDDGDDVVDGPFDGSTFVIDPDTNIAWSSNGDGHPVFVRCVSQTGSHLDLIDGDGTPYSIDTFDPDSDGLPIDTDAEPEEGDDA